MNKRMVKTRVGRLIASLSVCAAGLVGASAFAADPIKMGLVGPLTGPAANTGLTVRSTFELVATRVNAAGGLEIDGVKRPLQIIAADSESKPSVGVSAAQRLLSRDNVDILVGDLLHSDVTLGIMELAQAYPKKTFMTPLSVSTTISDRIEANPAKYGNFWKAGGDSEAYALSTAAFLNYAATNKKRSFEKKTVAFVFEETDYAKTIMASTVKELEKTGWKVVGSEGVPLATSDFYPQLTKLRGAAPEVTVSIFTAVSSGVAYIRQSKEQKSASEQLAIYYPTFPAFRSAIGAAGNDLLYLGAALDIKRGDRGPKFAAAMAEAGIQPSGDAALALCAAEVLVDAIKIAKSLDRKALDPAFSKVDHNTCPNYNRTMLDAKRHSPRIGPGGFFMGALQLKSNGQDFMVVWPEDAATGKLD